MLKNVRVSEKRSRPDEPLVVASARSAGREQAAGRQATEPVDVNKPTTVAGEPRIQEIGPMPVTPPPAADTQVASSADNPMDMPPMATAGQSTDDAVATTGTDAAGVLLSGKSAPPNGTAAARDVGDLARTTVIDVRCSKTKT